MMCAFPLSPAHLQRRPAPTAAPLPQLVHVRDAPPLATAATAAADPSATAAAATTAACPNQRTRLHRLCWRRCGANPSAAIRTAWRLLNASGASLRRYCRRCRCRRCRRPLRRQPQGRRRLRWFHGVFTGVCSRGAHGHTQQPAPGPLLAYPAHRLPALTSTKYSKPLRSTMKRTATCGGEGQCLCECVSQGGHKGWEQAGRRRQRQGKATHT